MALYKYDGTEIAVVAQAIDYDKHIKSVNHRGYNSVAPENTLPAFKLSREMGFRYVETDVSFTSDGVAVCLHDSTINRTSNGTGNISDLTFEQVRQYDFCYGKTAYSPCLIPSFEEFITLCKKICLHPYIELKSTGAYTQAQIESVVDAVKAAGMDGNVTYISFSDTYLGHVKNYDASARLGYLVSGANNMSSSAITTAQGLKTATNEVFIDTDQTTAAAVALCKNAEIPMEVWTINNANTIKSLDPYITGVTSDSIHAGKILYEEGMS